MGERTLEDFSCRCCHFGYRSEVLKDGTRMGKSLGRINIADVFTYTYIPCLSSIRSDTDLL